VDNSPNLAKIFRSWFLASITRREVLPWPSKRIQEKAQKAALGRLPRIAGGKDEEHDDGLANASPFHKELSRILKDLGVPHVNEAQVAIYSVDVALKHKSMDGKDVCIEADGASHYFTNRPSTPTGKTLHRRYILASMGYRIITISLHQWSSTARKQRPFLLKDLLRDAGVAVGGGAHGGTGGGRKQSRQRKPSSPSSAAVLPKATTTATTAVRGSRRAPPLVAAPGRPGSRVERRQAKAAKCWSEDEDGP